MKTSPTLSPAAPIWGGPNTSLAVGQQTWTPRLYRGPEGLVMVLTEGGPSLDLTIPVRFLARRLAHLPFPVEKAVWITQHPPRPEVPGSQLLGENFFRHELEISWASGGADVRLLTSDRFHPHIAREEVESLIGGAL